MSASERLKARYAEACIPEPSDPTKIWLVDNDYAEPIVSAIPQIIAVVEAAEDEVYSVPGTVMPTNRLQSALADLEEKLS